MINQTLDESNNQDLDQTTISDERCFNQQSSYYEGTQAEKQEQLVSQPDAEQSFEEYANNDFENNRVMGQ